MGFVTLQSQKRPAMGMISQINMLKHERDIYICIYTHHIIHIAMQQMGNITTHSWNLRDDITSPACTGPSKRHKFFLTPRVTMV